MREFIKHSITDSPIGPYVRFLVKRLRGIPMPFDLVKNEIYDHQAAAVIARTLDANANAVDIGCHKGQFLELFLRHAPAGNHYAFEPIPHLAHALQENYPDVTVQSCALADKDGETTFYVIPDRPALSGLNTRDFLAKGDRREAIPISVKRLDGLIPPEQKISLIKIDVEGAEGLVIKGAIETLRRNRPIVILEHGSVSSGVFGFSSEDVFDLLVKQCGLKLSLPRNWLRQTAPLTRSAFAASRDWYFVAHP